MAISRIIGGPVMAAVLAVGGAAQAQSRADPAKAPVMVRAEQCLRQKVDRVVADEPDVAAAANFLVGYACAEDVAAATRYLRNETFVQLFSEVAKLAAASSAAKPQGPSGQAPNPAASAAAAATTAGAMAALVKVDPETGEMHVSLPGAQAAQVNGMLSQTSSVLSQFMPDNIPVPIRKLAGELVLDARERHKAR